MAPPAQLHQGAAWQPRRNRITFTAGLVVFGFRFQAELSAE